MLKEWVRERLIAAADEIFGLFERTIASYEEELCRAREETERHRRQLQAFGNSQIVSRVHGESDVQQWGGSASLEWEDPQSPYIKEEEEEPGVSRFPMTGVSVESTEDMEKSPEWLQFFGCYSPNGDHCEGPPPDNPFGPPSDGENVEETLWNDADCKASKFIGITSPKASNADAMRKSRKKLKQNPEAYQKHLERERERYRRRKSQGKIKHIQDLPELDQLQLRRKWSTEKRSQRKERKEAHNQPSTPAMASPEPQTSNSKQKRDGCKRMKKNERQAYGTIKKQKGGDKQSH
ncbi:uncharacterized protein LOC133400223 isoform X1 [Phycodurus eques]|uniref:uncharacterized protein LOC133400223 isoform X1 n=1 Tax=Phycodurus eques TaxID=693459 RepID=UPI002ACD7B32|nr:uncharacterized protein LOC133400223 isoform X1 [Phycodurus eques]